MPNRIARDSARYSETLEQLSDGAERTFWRLMLAADDWGRFLADPRWVLAECHPLSVNRLTVKVVLARLEEMGKVGLVFFYDGNGRVYGQFAKAHKYFTRRAKHSRHPPPPEDASLCYASATHLLRTCTTSASEVSRLRGIEVSRSEDATNESPRTDSAPSSAPPFLMNDRLKGALERSPAFKPLPQLRKGEWWQAQIRANPSVDFPGEILKAQAWLLSNPSRAPKSNLVRFLHNWLARAGEREA